MTAGINTIQARTADTEKGTFLIGDLHTVRSGILAASNGTTNFGLVRGGTPLGEITASKKLRPCGKTTANGAQASVNQVAVNETKGFRTSDVVDVLSTLGVEGTAVLDGDGASGADIEIESSTADGIAHAIQIVNPGADHDLQAAVTLSAAGLATVVVTLEYASAAIQSTVDEVIAEINASAGQWIEARLASGGTGSNTAAAVASTPLAGGIAPGGTIATGRTVSGITPDTDMTLSGAAFTVADGDKVQLNNGAQTAVGYMYDVFGVSTANHIDHSTGAAVATDMPVQYFRNGDVREAGLPFTNALIKADLSDVRHS